MVAGFHGKPCNDILETSGTRRRMDEEEEDWFPKVRDGLGRNALQEIGEELLAAKKKAPTKPSQPSALKKTVDAVLD